MLEIFILKVIELRSLIQLLPFSPSTTKFIVGGTPGNRLFVSGGFITVLMTAVCGRVVDTGRTVTSSALVELADLIVVEVCLADLDLDKPDDDLLDKLLVIE